MKTEECRQLISQLRGLLADSGTVAAGLKRLAFGSCTDAVYLVFADELPLRRSSAGWTFSTFPR